MKLYNSFCYLDIDSVNSSVASNFFLGDGSVLVSSAVINSDQINITYERTTKTYTKTITVPDCFSVGFDNSFFGISVQDSLDAAWLSAIVLILAWGVKILKKGA